MKILDMRVKWMLDWANDPYFEILVDKIPDWEALRYECRGGLYYAELDGYVSFYAWNGPGNEGGYCGRAYPIRLKSGEEVKLLGPWSSRAGQMNSAGFEPCVDVSITDEPAAFKRGHTFMGGAVTLALIKEALPKFLPNVEMYCEREHNTGVKALILGSDVTYIPALKGMSPEKSKQYLSVQESLKSGAKV